MASTQARPRRFCVTIQQRARGYARVIRDRAHNPPIFYIIHRQAGRSRGGSVQLGCQRIPGDGDAASPLSVACRASLMRPVVLRAARSVSLFTGGSVGGSMFSCIVRSQTLLEGAFVGFWSGWKGGGGLRHGGWRCCHESRLRCKPGGDDDVSPRLALWLKRAFRPSRVLAPTDSPQRSQSPLNPLSSHTCLIADHSCPSWTSFSK